MGGSDIKPRMTLDLSSNDYRKLIELAYLGEWLINAHHDAEIQDDEASRVLQTLLANSPDPSLVKKDPETGDFFMDDAWVERLYDSFILDYDDHVFWDELTERLAQRDLAATRGIDQAEINREDDLIELLPLEERYHRELEQHGIDRLTITNDYEA